MRLTIALTLLVSVAAPSGARANYAFQGVAAASVGWTNNASGAPANTPNTPTDPDTFFLITPGVTFTSSLARAVQKLSYTFSALLYAHHSELSTLNNHLSWEAAITPTRNVELLLSITGAEAQLNTINSVTVDSTTQPVQLTRSGTTTYWTAGTTESMIWKWSALGRMLQSASFQALISEGAGLSKSYTLSGTVGPEKIYRTNAFAGLLRVDYIYFSALTGPVTNTDGTVNPNGVVTPQQQDIIHYLTGRWRRDIGHFWNIELSGGALLLMRATDGGGRIWQPTALAGVHYLHPKFQSDLTYSHGANPNPLINEVLVSDIVTVRASVPLGVRAKIAFNTGGFYSHSKEAGSSGDSSGGSLTGAIDLYTVDAGFGWFPVPGLSLFSRYTFAYQTGGSTAAVPVPDMLRHVVLFGIAGTYPTQAAAVVPSRQALRVDGTDMTFIGDLHAKPPESTP